MICLPFHGYDTLTPVTYKLKRKIIICWNCFLKHSIPLSWTHLYRELQVFALWKQFKKKKTTSSTEQAVNEKFSL
jgi:hypothetical protein